MKKSCFGFLVVFLLVGAGYFYLVRRHAPLFGALILALFGAISIVLIISGVKNIFATMKKMKAVNRALQGIPPDDGAIAAAVGTIRPEGAAMTSPVFGKECVIYEYNVFKDLPQQSGKPVRDIIYTGMAMSPCFVQGYSGKVRIFGIPDLQHIQELRSIDTENMARFDAYARGTQFEPAIGMQKLKLFEQLTEVMQDVDGTTRKDWRMKEAPENFTGIQLAEKIIGVGEKVVAFGKYSGEKQGIINQMGSFGAMNEIFIGEPDSVGKKIRGNAVFLLIFALVWFSFVNGIVYFITFVANKGS